MNTTELKEYLSIVVDMEKSIFLQKNLISSFNQQLSQLEKPEYLASPDKPTPPRCKETFYI